MESRAPRAAYRRAALQLDTRLLLHRGSPLARLSLPVDSLPLVPMYTLSEAAREEPSGRLDCSQLPSSLPWLSPNIRGHVSLLLFSGRVDWQVSRPVLDTTMFGYAARRERCCNTASASRAMRASSPGPNPGSACRRCS